ncbi:MAG: hypothetical protein C3F17_13470 [Bradyrhizobiaceae bacterium]|nr:MAG: hypothetical protein C3F17_13470 [Bradyrhizobiaceae bacterium]
MSMPTGIRLRSADAATGVVRFDYRGMHRYLITLPAGKGGAVLNRPETVVPVLDLLREAGWKEGFDVYAYCFLPARLVLMVRGKDKRSDMKRFLAIFRESSNAFAEATFGHGLWARKYLERVLRKGEQDRDVARSVFDLPRREGVAARGEEYQYQGSFVDLQAASSRHARPPKPSPRGGPPRQGGPPRRRGSPRQGGLPR